MPTLYLMVGYPGAGKTTVAQLICDLTGAIHLWADKERQAMFGDRLDWSESESKALYDRLNSRTSMHLKDGHSVVFDANFNYYRDRERLRSIASHHHAKTVLVWINTPHELSHHRATNQSHGQPTRLFGNMHPAIFHRIVGNFEAPEAHEEVHQIDGTHITSDVLKKLLEI